MNAPSRTALYPVVVALLLLSSHAVHAQMPSSVLMVNVSNELVRANLSLTRLAVAEVGDQYTVGGTVVGRGRKIPKQVVLRVLTSTGHRLARSSRLQSGPFGAYGFLVLMPKDEGIIKMVTISLK